MQTTEIIQAVISGLILAFALGAYDFIKKQCCKKEQKEFIRNKIISEIKEILSKGDDNNVIRYRRFIRGMNVVISHRSDCIKSEELYPIIEVIKDAEKGSLFSKEKENENLAFASKMYTKDCETIFNELKNVKWLRIED